MARRDATAQAVRLPRRFGGERAFQCEAALLGRGHAANDRGLSFSCGLWEQARCRGMLPYLVHGRACRPATDVLATEARAVATSDVRFTLYSGGVRQNPASCRQPLCRSSATDRGERGDRPGLTRRVAIVLTFAVGRSIARWLAR